jgi:hypothetical protein
MVKTTVKSLELLYAALPTESVCDAFLSSHNWHVAVGT